MALWEPNSWQKIAADKQSRIAASIPEAWRITTPNNNDSVSVMGCEKSCGFMSEEELIITGSSAVDLVAKMAKGELKSVVVTTAFLKRAALAHQLVSLFKES